METDEESRYEAARLAQVPRQEQEAIVAWLKEIADNPKVKQADRQLARERAKALESLLPSDKKRPKKNKT